MKDHSSLSFRSSGEAIVGIMLCAQQATFLFRQIGKTPMTSTPSPSNETTIVVFSSEYDGRSLSLMS
jgi:hypothetical protein